MLSSVEAMARLISQYGSLEEGDLPSSQPRALRCIRNNEAAAGLKDGQAHDTPPSYFPKTFEIKWPLS